MPQHSGPASGQYRLPSGYARHLPPYGGYESALCQQDASFQDSNEILYKMGDHLVIPHFHIILSPVPGLFPDQSPEDRLPGL